MGDGALSGQCPHYFSSTPSHDLSYKAQPELHPITGHVSLIPRPYVAQRSGLNTF
jgi:hypothetical protein